MKPLRLISLALIWMLCSCIQADSLIIVKPRETELTRAFASALRTNFPQRTVEVALLEQNPDIRSAPLVVTMGLDALQWRLEQNSPARTVGVYITLDQISADQGVPPFVQILLASPRPERQLILTGLLFPRMQEAGVLYSPAQRWQLQHWQEAAAQLGLSVRAGEVKHPRELLRVLTGLLDSSDVLLGIEDPAIYNADTVKPLLLTSYSRNRVLIGPSAPFIAAGSLSTTYSTPEDMADSIRLLLEQRWQPGAIGYPQRFSVLSNPQVARSLGLPLPDASQLQRAIQTRERSLP